MEKGAQQSECCEGMERTCRDQRGVEQNRANIAKVDSKPVGIRQEQSRSG